MRGVEIGNAVFALLMELVLLGAAVLIGLRLPAPAPVAVGAAVLLPALVVAIWAFALAPRSATRLGTTGRLAAQALLFALAAIGVAAVGLWPLAAVIAAAASVRLGLGVAVKRV